MKKFTGQIEMNGHIEVGPFEAEDLEEAQNRMENAADNVSVVLNVGLDEFELLLGLPCKWSKDLTEATEETDRWAVQEQCGSS